MYKSESWTTEYEISRILTNRYEGEHPSGPSLYDINGVDYTDSSNSHICVTGATGMGKTLYVTLPFVQDILDKGESLILVETKGQCFAAFESRIPQHYQCRAVDLRRDNTGPDGCDFAHLNTEKPFAVFIILPDRNKNSLRTAAKITDRLARILEDRAAACGGRLPKRVNVIAEDIALTGKGIPCLPVLAHQGHSRNIRVMYTSHGAHSAKLAFGKNAKLLESCCGLTIGFSANCTETLEKWSQLCGERVADAGGTVRHTPLASPISLWAMPMGTALVIKEGRYKFMTHFKEPVPGFAAECKGAGDYPEDTSEDLQDFDMTDFEIIRENADRALSDLAEEEWEQLEQKLHRNMANSKDNSFIETIAADIDRRKNCGRAEDASDSPQDGTAMRQPKYFVELCTEGDNVMHTAKIISDHKGYNMLSSVKLLYDLPLALQCDSKKAADMLALEFSAAGAKAKVKTTR